MAKKQKKRLRTRLEQNAFVKGLITEANPLAFPENASLAEENFVLDRDGSRFRRLGIDEEQNGVPTIVKNTVVGADDLETFVWKNAGNSRNLNIAVVKIENKFYFFDADAASVTKAILNTQGTGVPIFEPIPKVPSIPTVLTQYDYAFAHGFMIVTTGEKVVHIVSYDPVKDAINVVNEELEIRDLFGIEDTILEVDTRPQVLLNNHQYNLRNQGWKDDILCASGALSSVTPVDSLEWTQEKTPTFYPSNADTMWANKSSSGFSEEVLGMYNVQTLLGATYGSQQAPRGHFFIDLFDRGASRLEKALLAPAGAPAEPIDPGLQIWEERTAGGITSCTSYMGRVVYTVTESVTDAASVAFKDGNSPSLGSMVFFSRASEKIGDLTKCSSFLDPTSGEEFSNLATDGGFFVITGLGQVNSLEVNGNSLYVFSDKGVWQINGGDRIFTSTNININKVTNVGNVGRRAVEVAEDNIFYLSNGGMYILGNGSDSAQAASVKNITQTTIQTLYDLIPEVSKTLAVSYYDKFTRQIHWLFGNELLPNPHYYNKELIYDLNLQAFSLYDIKEDGKGEFGEYVIGFLERAAAVIIDSSLDIVVGNDEVILSVGSQDIAVTVSRRVPDITQITATKYWSMRAVDNNDSLIKANEYKNVRFLDWKVADAEAFLLTGYVTGGDSASFKRANYITTHMRRTEKVFLENSDGDFVPDNPSACTLQAQWEWTNSPASARWSNIQEIYRLPRTFVPDESGEFDYGHSVITTKNKLRGKGRALSLLFKTKPLHDCHLYGWSIEINAETEV